MSIGKSDLLALLDGALKKDEACLGPLLDAMKEAGMDGSAEKLHRLLLLHKELPIHMAAHRKEADLLEPQASELDAEAELYGYEKGCADTYQAVLLSLGEGVREFRQQVCSHPTAAQNGVGEWHCLHCESLVDGDDYRDPA